MADREKVMKDLSWLIFNFPWQENPKDDADRMCNAIHTYCNDALDLLKEQEPRVLTWKDVKESIGVPVWVEYEDYDSWNGYGVPTSYYRNLDYGECVLIYGANAYSAHYENTYNMKWRCWTSRPTPEQMEETPWEEKAE